MKMTLSIVKNNIPVNNQRVDTIATAGYDLMDKTGVPPLVEREDQIFHLPFGHR